MALTEVGLGSVGGLRESRLRAWLRLWRFHFAPLTLATGVAGMAAWPGPVSRPGLLCGALLCFTGFGVGAVLNDYADREADAINAPERPLVSGALDPRSVLLTACVVAVLVSGAALLAAPAAVLWGALTLGGHVLYGRWKRIPMLGNLTNGADIALFAVVGAAAAAGRGAGGWWPLEAPVAAVLGLCALVHSGFCLATYFKDVPGDRAVGYRTLPVVLGPWTARWLLVPFWVGGVGLAAALALGAPGLLGADRVAPVLWPVLAASGAAMAVAQIELARDPRGRAYEALLWYSRGAILFPLALAAASLGAPAAWLAGLLVLFFELTVAPTRRYRQA